MDNRLYLFISANCQAAVEEVAQEEPKEQNLNVTLWHISLDDKIEE